MKRVKLLDYEIDTFKFEEAVNYAGELLKNDKVNQVVTINPEMFETALKDEEFSQILKEAEMVIPDGIGVKLGLKIMGENVTRIAGVDFARRMIDYATAEADTTFGKIGIKVWIYKGEVLPKKNVKGGSRHATNAKKN